MYDENYDEFEPVDPTDGGTFSTATPERKRNVGLAIILSLVAVVLCAGITLANLFSVRIERRGGSTSVIFTERRSEIPVTDVDVGQPPDDLPEPTLELNRPGWWVSASPTQELYKKLQNCVVYVAPDYAALDNADYDSEGGCTGVVMSDDGYIITCYHVIAQTGAVKVTLSDGTEYVAAKVGSDPTTDLSVLKIEAGGLDCVSFSDSDQLAVGEQVLSLSRSEDPRLGSVMTDGIVCSLGKDLDFNDHILSVMQTNACSPSGSYGAPVVNTRGEVVGIRVSSIGTMTEGDLGLVIPMSSAKSIVDELIENGFISGQPTLSIRSLAVPSSARAYYGLPAGAFVESVDEGGCAQAAGIVAGDVIVGIEGTEVSSYEELDSIVKNNYKAGDTVTLRVYRASLSREVKEFDLALVLDEVRR